MSAADLDIPAIKASCDVLVSAAPDRDAAMAAVVLVWALGGMAADDLLDDLELHAVEAGLARGIELTAPELFECCGHPERAVRVRKAVEQGRAAWMETAARAVRIADVVAAREAA